MDPNIFHVLVHSRPPKQLIRWNQFKIYGKNQSIINIKNQESKTFKTAKEQDLISGQLGSRGSNSSDQIETQVSSRVMISLSCDP